MLLKISRAIKRLNKDFDKLNEEEFKSSLIEIKNEINTALNSKGFFPTKDLVKDLLDQIRKLISNLENYDKTVKKEKVEDMRHDIEEIIDQQMCCEIGGAGEYLRNMREAAEKKNN